MNPSTRDLPELLRDLHAAALAAVEPGMVLTTALDQGPLPDRNPHLLAIGKAAPAMARAAVEWLRPRPPPPRDRRGGPRDGARGGRVARQAPSRSRRRRGARRCPVGDPAPRPPDPSRRSPRAPRPFGPGGLPPRDGVRGDLAGGPRLGPPLRGELLPPR